MLKLIPSILGGRNKKTCVLSGLIADLRKEILAALEGHEIGELLIHLGCNNVGTDSPQYIVHQLLALVREIKRISPTTKVFISSIIPRRVGENVNTDYSVFRQIFRKLQGASKSEPFTLVNNYQFWRKADNNPNERTLNYKLYSKRDYVHPNFKGVELLSENFTFRHTFSRDYDASSDSQNPPTVPTIALSSSLAPSRSAEPTADSEIFRNVENDVYIALHLKSPPTPRGGGLNLWDDGDVPK